MLSKRYNDDKKSLLMLNELQSKMKNQVEQKVSNGVYKFERVPCAVCDGNRFESVAKKDRYGLYMPVVCCSDCGLIQTNPRMNQNSYDEFYNCEYRKLYVGTEKPDSHFFRRQYNHGQKIFEYLKTRSLIKDDENKYVLEIGCGAGGILQYFKEKGWRVKGIDLGTDYIDFGKNQHDLDLSIGTINTIEHSEVPDLIIYSHVLEHILTPNDELEAVHKILSDTGLLYIEIPGVKNLMNSYDMDFLRLLQNAHTYHFTLKSLTNILKKNEFKLVVGDETVRSVFRKETRRNSSKKFENEFSNVKAYLHKVELLRIICPIPPYKIKGVAMSSVIKLLKTIGIFRLVQTFYHKIRTDK